MKIMPSKNMTSTSEKIEMEKSSEGGCYEKREDPADKENAMLKVLESMSRRIELTWIEQPKKTVQRLQYQISEGKISRHHLQEL